jgi:hypothetical protein
MESVNFDIYEVATSEVYTNEQELYNCLKTLNDGDPVIVDFDETLWLRNSTETFLSNVSPSLWVGFWLQLLGLVRPWRWLSPKDPDQTRDWVRVLTIVIVAPWSIWQWNKVAVKLAKQHLNQNLYHALIQSKHPVMVASYGFGFVIQPLLDSLNASWPLIVASDLKTAPNLRKEGKGAAVVKVLGVEVVQKGLSISDSKLDNDLLAMTRYSALLQWPEAKYQQAGLKPMLPFVYLKKIKRPDESYFTRAILGHDYLLLLLIFSLASTTPLLSALCLLLFVLSYFTAYEIGYYENDRLGLINECKPKVSKDYHKLAHNFVPYFSWIMSGLLAILASIVATQVNGLRSVFYHDNIYTSAIHIWLVFVILLIGVRLVFAWFNRLPEIGRIVPMLALQLARTTGYLLIFSTSMTGVLFCISQALSQWIPYMIYRFGGSRNQFPIHLVNFMLLLCFLTIVSLNYVGSFSTIWHHWLTWVLVGYSMLRAAIELRTFIKYVKLQRSD